MRLDNESCYTALRARDVRFDGLFYVGVRTTGVYCRPVCPARLPARDRCTFFRSAAEAEAAGYRACFRCRPELAPGHADVDARSRLARSAAARIEAGYLNGRSLEALSADLHVTSRHLRRTMEQELGISPVALAQTVRLGLAKRLLHDADMPLADVAFAAGFSSVRRFNALFHEQFGRPPSAVRRDHGDVRPADGITLRLDYRPPIEWDALLAFLRGRAIAGVDLVGEHEYRRTVAIGGRTGWIAVTRDPARPALRAVVSSSLARVLMDVAARLRALFDLDARPDVIAATLRQDRGLSRGVSAHPGLRVPGAFDPFELGVRAILGQQVSVAAATTLGGRLARTLGRPVGGMPDGLTHVFPAAVELAGARAAELQALGLTGQRARTVLAFARAVADGRVDLAPGSDAEAAVGSLQEIPGIGPWTAHYIVMRALKWPDAFPAADLVVRRQLGVTAARDAEARAEGWRPWRAYGVMHLWRQAAQTQGD
jgi:AraC family transcriptional regulator, regulatory protein of adaptative response / DNA-3-methyladenine glycosylase II